MENLNVDYNMLVTFAGAAIGAVKASVELNKDKNCFGRFVDVLVGVFLGASIAFHFHTEHSVALTGMLALVGGVSGGVVIDVFLQMLPSITRKFVKNWVNNKIRPQ